MRLILPVLIPSWRFFDVIAPSPRIEYRLNGSDWLALNPRPAHVSLMQMVRWLFCNHSRNESLYLVSCAEKILSDGSNHAQLQIISAVKSKHPDAAGLVQFQLICVQRKGRSICRDVAFRSVPYGV